MYPMRAVRATSLLRHALQLTLSPKAWATRTLIVRKLKGLEALIRKLLNYSIYNGTLICFECPAVTVVSPHMGTQGWPFAKVDKFPAADVDPLYDSEHVKDLY